MTREDAQVAWEKIVDTGFEQYDALTRDQRVWFNVEPLTTDGIIDHYINHGAEHNADTIEDLEFLGFSNVSDLLKKINNLFDAGKPPQDIDERNDEMETWNEKQEDVLDEIDDAYWELNDALEEALMQHICTSGIGK